MRTCNLRPLDHHRSITCTKIGRYRKSAPYVCSKSLSPDFNSPLYQTRAMDPPSHLSTSSSPGSFCNSPDSSNESPSMTSSTPATETSSTQEFPFNRDKMNGDPKAGARKKAAALSLEEQVSLLRAADFWRTVPILSKGISSIKTSDGPNGARGAIFKAGTKAALFPCGISLAASWNTDLLCEVGQHLAEEVKARSAHVLLAPTVCLHRGPLGGRNFESFSEDPFLTGKLAACYIKGVQRNGVAATIKHFVANEEETDRMNVDVRVDERALRELYLRPFEIAIREANPWALMSSYNKINGVHADMNRHTLQTILRGAWNYDGLVMSDWTGVNSIAESVAAGCDLEMPYSDKWRGDKLLKAVESEELSREAVEKSAANVLYLIERTRGKDISAEEAEREDDREDTRVLIRRAGVEGLTLLKNEGGVLPIKASQTKIAVIGPNAKTAVAHGGGSASLNPYYTTPPFDSISKVPGKDISYALGCQTYKWVPVASPFCTNTLGQPGVTLDFYTNDTFSGPIAVTQYRPNTDLFLWDSVPPEVGNVWSAMVKTSITPQTTGNHVLSFSSVGPGRLYADGKLVIDLWNWTDEGEAMFDGSEDILATLPMIAHHTIKLLVETNNEIRPISRQAKLNHTHHYGGCRIGFKEDDKTDYLLEAASAAAAADVAIVIVGLDAEWESEGYDRQTMDLPKNNSQDHLISAVAAANPNTIVVNQSGTPITMPWIDNVPAILQAWYQGQEAGNALADVLFGFANPSGKLPTTFPKCLKDNPSFHNWPGQDGQVVYEEGIYIGYRYYDRPDRNIPDPLFPFGHGLSYTTFSYGPLTLSSTVLSPTGSNSKLILMVPITNTGDVAGAEVVQAYVHDVEARVDRPVKELVAFGKVWLGPGETGAVELVVGRDVVGFWDEGQDGGRWVAEMGVFEVWVGGSSRDIR